MLGKRRWLSILTVAVLAILGFGLSAGADSASEAGFLAEINATRATQGLGPLTVDSGLRAHARNHTQDMMDSGGIYHSSSDELTAAAGSGWTKLGENVGRGGSVSSLHAAFLDSAGHRANILGDYNRVGIGTGTTGGVLYVTVVFMKKGSTPAPTTTTTVGGGGSDNPTTTTQPKPKATTTSTTIPPTTTTTMIVGPDKPVTPGESCVVATRFWWMCYD